MKTLDIIAREILAKGQIINSIEIVLDGDLVSDEQAARIKSEVQSYLPHLPIEIEWWNREMNGSRFINGLSKEGWKFYHAKWDWLG